MCPKVFGSEGYKCRLGCCGVIVQSNVVELRQYKLIFRRYASLYFIVGLDINGDDVRETVCL